MINKTKENFKILTRDGIKEVIGQKVSLLGYENLDLFVYKEDSKTIEFVLTEKRTGLQFSRGTSEKEAIEMGLNILKWQQSYNKEYPSIYEQINRNIEKYGTVDGSFKYDELPIPEISKEDKIKILVNKIKQEEQEIEDKRKEARKYFATANIEYSEKFIKQMKIRIEEIKNEP